jgi:hypothetical protein
MITLLRIKFPELNELVKMYPPDYKFFSGVKFFRVKMDTHIFSFITQITDREPEELKEFIESGTKHSVSLKDICIKDFKVKTYGDYSDVMSWIDWWIKKGNCMICFNFQGLGMPSQVIKDDVRDILNSLEYIEE